MISKRLAVAAVCMILLSACSQVSSPQGNPTQETDVSPATDTPKPQPTQRAVCPTYAGSQRVMTFTNGNGNTEPWVQTGDFNSDGLQDIMITWAVWDAVDEFPMEILLNDGAGGLNVATDQVFVDGAPSLPALPADSMAIADYNGDGFNDVFLAVSGKDAVPFPGAQNLLFLSDGSRGLINATGNLPTLRDFPHSVATADVDLDGDTDIFVGNIWAGNLIPPQLLLNDGRGVFTQASHLLPSLLSLNHNGYTASEFVDIDLDGDPDLLLADAGDDIPNTFSDRDSHVLLNNGNAYFNPLAGAMPSKGADTWVGLDILPMHLNLDGYPDLVIAYTDDYRGYALQVLLNNQDGTFSDATDERMPGAQNADSGYIYALDSLDFDHDGDLDIIGRTWDDRQNPPYIFINDGNGYFEKQVVEIELGWLYYTIIDLDDDGGFDFVLASVDATTEFFIIREMGCE